MPWEITRDYLFEQAERDGEAMRFPSHVGRTSADDLPTSDKQVKFRLYDDDGELYYEGTLDDDEEFENQEHALTWGARDSGCTTIKVRRKRYSNLTDRLHDHWRQEIG